MGYKKGGVKFGGMKLVKMVGKMLLNVLFVVVCGWVDVDGEEIVRWLYKGDYVVGYILVWKVIMWGLEMLFLIGEVGGVC